jgi:predicted DNA-binding transcriptional regulator YafY
MQHLPGTALLSNGTQLGDESGASSVRLPLARLIQLLVILQEEPFPNATRLAEACGVSRRTIYRDLTILEAAGITILYQPDRQGYRLDRECLLEPPKLDDREALALLIMSRLGCAHDPFGLWAHARSAVDKVLHTLPAGLRGKLKSSRELILDEPIDLDFPKDRREIYQTILTTLSERRRLRITYRPDERSPVLTTLLSLYRLARIQRQWALVGHSSLHRRVVIARVPWIQRLELTDQPYSIPPRFRLDRFLELSDGEPIPRQHEVHLRFTPQVAPAVRDTPRQRGQSLSPRASGELDLVLSVEHLDEAVPWVLGFGDQVEVLKPEALRAAVRDCALRIAQIHCLLSQ